MKRNRKYQLNENPSVGGLEHTFANARIRSSRINYPNFSPENPDIFFIYDIPAKSFLNNEK